ncbi:hypothetical protein [Streptomonospora litoralis]|uniref:Uncharacterized protein n=1 Tax=Streptomonospora litoralis TaxID=2498135 RepID=A0A4P6Q7I0_9ACTN|nr:hypothetical protein [Streptomonospora litoralis]QBI56756.1 hypothetical protein EKD16_25075 [Streptomonospora litoralis]
MIKAEPGHFARFEPTPPVIKYTDSPIAAWADDGHPMVVRATGLVRADSISGYMGINSDPDPNPTPYAFLPGDGWAVQYDDGAVPLVAWAMCTYGGLDATFAVPMVAKEEASYPSGSISTLGAPASAAESVTVVPISEARGLRAP